MSWFFVAVYLGYFVASRHQDSVTRSADMMWLSLAVSGIYGAYHQWLSFTPWLVISLSWLWFWYARAADEWEKNSRTPPGFRP